MDSPLWIYLIGLSAQLFYVGRVLVQWIASEKSHRVESPGLFWIMSIMGSMILFLYGYLRKDVSIIFGECLSFYIYMWNISAKGLYKRVPKVLIVLQALFPVILICAMVKSIDFTTLFLRNEDLPLKLMIFGIIGQFIYKMRFVYQLLYSYRHGESSLPLGFWIMAVTGSLMIIIYGLIRHDWVLVVGQFGIVASIRNIMIWFSDHKKKENETV